MYKKIEFSSPLPAEALKQVSMWIRQRANVGIECIHSEHDDDLGIWIAVVYYYEETQS